jgi:hypothetical protein
VTAPSITLKKCLLFAEILVSTAFQPARYTVQPPKTPQTVISGRGWAFTVPFKVDHVEDIEKLIACESQGANVARPDSDGRLSVGILQFHMGPQNTMKSSTWQLFSEASGITGNPMIPADAIRMTDWAISHGLGPHWTCWHLTHLER